MKAESLKNKIVKKLATINDEGLLEEIYNLLNDKHVLRDEEVKYSISKENYKELSKTIQKHNEGKMKYYSLDEVRKVVKERLKK